MTITVPDLHRLVYYSRNRVANDSAAEIDSILGASRRNNIMVGVTGALVFNSGIFAQVLEGTSSAIEGTFERIQRDPRHGDVQVLAFGPVEERAFPGWSMGFLGRSRADQEIFAEVAVTTGFDPDKLNGDRILSIMKLIAIDEELSAA